jgi:hypothetical protein
VKIHKNVIKTLAPAAFFSSAGIMACVSTVDNVRSLPPQGCQMVCFQTKNPNLGKFWRALEWKMLKYFMAIWNIL